MFENKKNFQKKMGNGNLPRLDGELVNQFSLGMYTELGEVLQEYKGWKPWKNSDNYTNNREECLEELSDLWHFIINLSLALNFDYDDIYNAFMRKSNKLDEREQNNASDN